MDKPIQILGDCVKQARERLHKTQTQISDEAHINNQTVLKIENYVGNPNFTTLYPLIRTLSIDPREIFYPELQQDSPEIRQLRMLIESCSDKEAQALISVVQSFLSVVRDTQPTPTE